MILDDITEKRRIQLDREKQMIPFDKVRSKAERETCKYASFSAALKKDGISIISEVKKASPSKGVIQPDFDPVRIAKEYEKSGADAVSCLTEEFYFQGSSEYFGAIRKEIKIPMLRKDFIIDPYQIYEAKVMGADAVLLIAAILSDKDMREFKLIAESLGMDILAEVHDENELMRVLEMDFEIIGINNRNLKTFEVTVRNTANLAKLIPGDRIIVSESGIKNVRDMKFVYDNGADAMLVGETLMRSGNIAKTITELRSFL